MPLLTVIYTPNEFGIFILYTSIVLSLIPIAGLRYDYGIILPKKHQTAWHLMALTIKIIFIFSIICLVFLALSKMKLAIY